MLRAGTFYADVRATVLTGLSTATAGAIAATDTLIVALAKLQATISSLAPIASPSFTGNVNMAAKLAVAGFILPSNAPSIAAAGSTLATATPLTKQINIVISATAAPTGGVGAAQANGVSLPDNSPAAGYSATTTIVNTTATALLVYPPNSNAKIMTATATTVLAGATFSIAAGAAKDFIQVSSTLYWTA